MSDLEGLRGKTRQASEEFKSCTMDRMTKETTIIHPQMRAPPTTDTTTTTGLKRAAEEPVEEIDAERALEPRPEEVDMELNTIENLKHILELETRMEENFDE